MTRQTPWYALATIIALPSFNSFAADPPTTEERLQKLEGVVDSLKKENADLRKELGYTSQNPLVVVKPAASDARMTLGGFLQAQAEVGKSPDARFNGVEDRFLLRRARLNVQGSFLARFDYKLEADFGANTLGESSAYRAGLTDMYVNWNRYDFANIKLGQFKIPYGYEQLVSDTKILTVERSLPNDRLTDGRQIGLGVAGSFLEKRVGYSVGLFNGTSVNNSFNDNDQFMYVGRVYGTPLKTKLAEQDLQLTVGLNGLVTADNGTNGPAGVAKSGFGFDTTPGGAADNFFTGDRAAWGVDAQLTFGPFDLQAEYLRSHFRPTDNLPANEFDGAGWYVLAGYYILPKKLQAVAKFETFDPNTSVGGNSTDVWTFGLNYYVKGDDVKLMLNYLLGDRAGGSGFAAKDHQGRLIARAQIMF